MLFVGVFVRRGPLFKTEVVNQRFIIKSSSTHKIKCAYIFCQQCWSEKPGPATYRILIKLCIMHSLYMFKMGSMSEPVVGNYYFV